MCAYCGGRVAKSAPRNYCASHARLFGKFEDELDDAVEWDRPLPDIPLYREPDPS
jgi:hypothetical protein